MSVFFDTQTKTFYLDGKGVTYAFFINKNGFAEHLYYGKTIGHDDLTYIRTASGRSCPSSLPGKIETIEDRPYDFYPAEISFFGTSDYREPTVEVVNPTGDRLTELLYDSFEILPNKPKISGMPSLDGGETLLVHLKDRVTGFMADLYYTVYDDCSVIARRIVYKNGTADKIRLNRAYSFAFTLPGIEYDMIALYGAWARERIYDRAPLHRGVSSIDSKRATSSASLNPFMAIVDRNATENLGEAYGINLVYSSSYVLKAEGRVDGTVHLTGGINDFDFSWTLDAGEEFETPEVVIAYSNDGIGGMSRALHDAYREHLIPKRFVKKHRPVVINHWEGTTFTFDNAKLMSIADAVKGTGIDTFVLDDGWFGKRDNALSGLGDWYVNTNKLGGSLTELIEHINSIGMDFGIWFEPEMISEDSDIFRAHPEYAIGAPNRPRCYGRNQYCMDLTREDVRDYIVESINKIIRSHNVKYVKWDYNRNVSEFYSPSLPPERQSEFAHRYVLGAYDLFERIVNANPEIFFEGCSSGGARFDPAILHYFPQIWTSDNTDIEERTFIQYGTSLAYPVSTMSCHVSKSPSKYNLRPSDFISRGHIAQMGPTGYELDTTEMPKEDIEAILPQVNEYLDCEDLILSGDLYRIDNPNTSNYFSYMLVAKDKSRATLTAYKSLGRVEDAIKRIRPTGLDPNSNYFIRELNITLSGKTIMNAGITPCFIVNGRATDFKAIKYHFEKV